MEDLSIPNGSVNVITSYLLRRFGERGPGILKTTPRHLSVSEKESAPAKREQNEDHHPTLKPEP